MAVKKAKVGEYVKVIKKLPYKDNMDVEIGDIGVVNYVASTGKYSVHIDGKKNPHDDDPSQRLRSYGKKYDFWIPFECCEVVDNEELTKECLFVNADALDTYIGTTDNKVCLSTISSDVSTWSGVIYKSDCSTPLYDCSTSTYAYYPKEREENKMKEIKNQKVVDLYFKRKNEALEDEYKAARDAIVKADKNYIFIQQLNEQFKKYVDENEIEENSEKPFPVLPLTTESQDTLDKVGEDNYKKTKELNNLKEEIIALLSGCDTYEQEMEILRNYDIVTLGHKLA